MDWSKNPPEFPTIAGSMEQFQTMLLQIVQKLEKVPLEELAGDARQTIRTLDDTLKSADRLIRNVDGAVPEARTMLIDVRKTLREVGHAAQSLRLLGDYLERHPEALIRGKKEDGR